MQHTPRDTSQLEAALNSRTSLSSASVIKEAWNITLSRGKADILAGYALAWLCSFILVSLLSPFISNNFELDEQSLPPEFVEQLNTSGQQGMGDAETQLQPGDAQNPTGLDTQQIVSLGLANLLAFLILSPVHLGVEMIGVSNVLGRRRSYKQAFGYIAYALPLVLLSVTISLLIFFGLNLLILPGLYIAVAASMASILVVEYRIGAGRALLSSIRAIHSNWFSVATILGVSYFLTISPTLMALTQGYIHPLTIAAFAAQFWFIPLLYNVKGVLYRNLFGGDLAVSDLPSDAAQPSDVKHDVFDA